MGVRLLEGCLAEERDLWPAPVCHPPPGLPPAKRQKEMEGVDTIHLNQLGVVPPPGLTVTPVGVNGGPGVPTPPLGAPNTPSRAKIATVSRVGGRPRIISWMDAPDDVYFYATDTTKYVYEFELISVFVFIWYTFISGIYTHKT